MKLGANRSLCIAALLLTASIAAPAAAQEQCDNGVDDDGDTVYDCGDADCFDEAICKPDGNREHTDARCRDWIDNDSDGQVDCDDSDCYAPGIAVCLGSAEKPGAGSSGGSDIPDDTVPELGEGMSIEDLIGKGGDKDGERNDVLCSDGVDNDNDGRTDCADFGCRFDPTVTICQGDPDFRFSVVARAEQSYDIESETHDTRFSTLQLRAFGPMPSIEDSFYLLSLRAEKTPRLTFAMFQVPLGSSGHFLNINSGGGGLSGELVRSAHKRLLLEPAYYLYNAFEAGNGAAVEVGGPIDSRNRALYRVYVAGGTGRFSGNVGGGFVSDETDNYTYSAGGKIHINLIGFHSRWDSSLLYVPTQLGLSIALGAKYDQRAQERFPAGNVSLVLKWNRFILAAENYTKRELEFKSWQYAYNVGLGVLVIPKRVLLAADFGEFLTTEMDDPPAELPSELARQLQETQWRVASHFYLWRNILVATLLYTDRVTDPPPGSTEEQIFREVKLVGSYRF